MDKKIIIYQIFTRLFGNRTNVCKHNGTIAENGCGKMNDFDAVFDAGIHFVERDDIFGVMVAELHQVPHFTVGGFGNLDADLHIDAFVAARGNKVDLLGIILTNIHIVPPPL